MDIPTYDSSVSAFDGIRTVSPALERYTTDVLLGDLWKRPQLSPRDRSIVTLSVLIARNQSAELPYYVDLALDSGLEPGEISELITHLAFYSGWANALAAVKATNPVFGRRVIAATQLAPASVDLLPIDAAAVSQLETAAQNFGAVAPGLVQFSTEVLFGNLWLRPGLAPRDRSLATLSTVVATGQFPQLASYIGRAMDNGLTRAQMAEVMTQLAFYSGWSSAFTALPIVKDVFENRPRQS
jgi:4-carboxymuconolactone decarboxylase